MFTHTEYTWTVPNHHPTLKLILITLQITLNKIPILNCFLALQVLININPRSVAYLLHCYKYKWPRPNCSLALPMLISIIELIRPEANQSCWKWNVNYCNTLTPIFDWILLPPPPPPPPTANSWLSQLWVVNIKIKTDVSHISPKLCQETGGKLNTVWHVHSHRGMAAYEFISKQSSNLTHSYINRAQIFTQS